MRDDESGTLRKGSRRVRTPSRWGPPRPVAPSESGKVGADH